MSRENLAIAATILLLPLLLLWPLPAVFTTELLSHPAQEAPAHIWGLWAAWHERQPLVIDTTLVTWPDSTSIVLIDPINILPYMLGHAIGGPAAGYNLLLYLGHVLLGVAGVALARRVGGDPLIGAVAAQICPPFIASPATGMTEEFGVGWVALFCVALLSFLESRTAWAGILAAILLSVCWYSGPYNGLWAGLIGLLIAAGSVRRIRRLAATAAVGVGGMVLTLPLANAILRERHQDLPGHAMPGHLPDLHIPIVDLFRGGLPFGADILDVLVPVQLTGGEASVSHTAYIGLLALVLAILGLRRWRAGWPWLLGALLFAILSIGPYLYLNGELLRYDGRPPMAPAAGLILLLSPLGQITRWNRAGAVAHLLLVPLIARIAPQRWSARIAITVVLLVDALVLAPLAWPLHANPIADLEASEAMARPGAILELPLVHTTLPPEDMWRDGNALAQTVHQRPFGGGLMQTPTSDFARMAHNRVQALMHGSPFSADIREQMIEQGFSYIAIYPRIKRVDEALDVRLRECFGEPLWQSPLIWLYDLHAVEGGCFLKAPSRATPE